MVIFEVSWIPVLSLIEPALNPCDIENGGCGKHTCVMLAHGKNTCHCKDGYTMNPAADPKDHCLGMLAFPSYSSPQRLLLAASM